MKRTAIEIYKKKRDREETERDIDDDDVEESWGEKRHGPPLQTFCSNFRKKRSLSRDRLNTHCREHSSHTYGTAILKDAEKKCNSGNYSDARAPGRYSDGSALLMKTKSLIQRETCTRSHSSIHRKRCFCLRGRRLADRSHLNFESRDTLWYVFHASSSSSTIKIVRTP